MESKAQRLLAGISAVIAAGYGATTLWIVGYSGWSLVGSGSWGIGAVSSGLFDVLMPLASAVANRVLVRWARRVGGVSRTLHRAHSMMLLLLAVLVVVLLAGIGAGLDPRLWIGIGLMAGLTLAAQSLLLAVILAFFARQHDG